MTVLDVEQVRLQIAAADQRWSVEEEVAYWDWVIIDAGPVLGDGRFLFCTSERENRWHLPVTGTGPTERGRAREYKVWLFTPPDRNRLPVRQLRAPFGSEQQAREWAAWWAEGMIGTDVAERDSDLVVWLGELASRLSATQLDAVERTWRRWSRHSWDEEEGTNQCVLALERAGVDPARIDQHLGE